MVIENLAESATATLFNGLEGAMGIFDDWSFEHLAEVDFASMLIVDTEMEAMKIGEHRKQEAQE